MKVIEKLREKIKKIPESEPFGYVQLNIDQSEFFAAAKALERLRKKGEIKKISKGVFFKPKKGVFGELGPNYDLLLKNYLYKDGKRVGYITGSQLYNQLNLTTQMAFRTKIATNKSRKKIDLGWLKTDIVKSYAEVTEENYTLLGILDAVKDIKIISDSSTGKVIRILIVKIKLFTKKDILNLIKYALYYPPKVRALLGAILEAQFKNIIDLETLKKSLNPSTTFKIGLKNSDLSTIQKWNIR